MDLKITVHAPEKVEAWINLLPWLKERGLKIEGHFKLKDNTIQLDILNKNFCKTTTIKNDQEIALFLLGQKIYWKNYPWIYYYYIKIIVCFFPSTLQRKDIYFSLAFYPPGNNTS